MRCSTCLCCCLQTDSSLRQQGLANVLPIYGLRIEDQKYQCFYETVPALISPVGEVVAEASATAGAYTHVACVWKPDLLSGTMDIYVNGILAQSTYVSWLYKA